MVHVLIVSNCTILADGSNFLRIIKGTTLFQTNDMRLVRAFGNSTGTNRFSVEFTLHAISYEFASCILDGQSPRLNSDEAT